MVPFALRQSHCGSRRSRGSSSGSDQRFSNARSNAGGPALTGQQRSCGWAGCAVQPSPAWEGLRWRGRRTAADSCCSLGEGGAGVGSCESVGGGGGRTWLRGGRRRPPTPEASLLVQEGCPYSHNGSVGCRNGDLRSPLTGLWPPAARSLRP